MSGRFPQQNPTHLPKVKGSQPAGRKTSWRPLAGLEDTLSGPALQTLLVQPTEMGETGKEARQELRKEDGELQARERGVPRQAFSPSPQVDLAA